MSGRRHFASKCLSQLRKSHIAPTLLRLHADYGRFALASGAAGRRLYAQFPPGGFPQGFQGMNINGASPAKGEALKEYVSCLVFIVQGVSSLIAATERGPY